MPNPEMGSYHSRGGYLAPLYALPLAIFMSVYTTVEPDQLNQFLRRYDLGEAVSFEPIAAGVTNTNYCLDTTQGNFVLTLYEHHSDDELDYMLGLQCHLAKRSVKCSQPLKDRRGDLYSSLNQRPAAIIGRLPGDVCARPAPVELALIGAELARFHVAGMEYQGIRPNPRGLDWMIAATDMLREHLGNNDQLAIAASLRAARDINFAELPQSAIHADLFHDNALFHAGELGGIIDFDYACTDSCVFDIAILLNDWCIDADNHLVDSRVGAILGAYQQHRQLQATEIDALPLMLRLTALRFWLSRLYDQVFPLSGDLTFVKNPGQFRDMHALRSAGMTRPVAISGLPA
jgi:homoserine kinase type II